MDLNIDKIIFLIFLLINLLVGLFYSKGVKNVKDYAIGSQNFSSREIAATLIATSVSGSYFTITMSLTYTEGLYFLVSGLGQAVAFLIIAFVFAPHMRDFLGKLSIAEALGGLYGKNIRIITAFFGLIRAIGVVAVQFKISSGILEYFLGVSYKESLLFSSLIVIIYSAFGGIKAVIFTDILQFFTFGIFIPLLALIIWGALENPYKVLTTLNEDSRFSLSQLFDIKNPKFYLTYLFFIYFSIPEFSPSLFQRIAMAKSICQIRESFTIAAIVCFSMKIFMGIIAILILADNPNLNPTNLVPYIIDHYSYTGMKGFVVVGIMAMIMSTADSQINTAAILFGNDLLKPLGIWFNGVNILPYRIFALLIGVIALIAAIYTKDILEVILSFSSFYDPIITVPFILTVLGFRSSSKVVLISMTSGVLFSIFWKLYFKDAKIEGILLGMLTNLVFYITSHYFFNKSPSIFK